MQNNPLHPLQKTGHADLVQDEQGQWYMAFLTGRPLSPNGRCPLGRETAIVRLQWLDNEWPYVEVQQELPNKIPAAIPIHEHIDFSQQDLPPTYQSLRVPLSSDWGDWRKNEGVFRVKGRESLASTFEQSLLARRVQALDLDYEIQLSFSPTSFQQMAGLVCYYNTAHHFYLHIRGDEDGKGRWLDLVKVDNYAYEEPVGAPIHVPSLVEQIGLRVRWRKAMLQFDYQWDRGEWNSLPAWYDGSILSDDYVRDGSDRYRPAFTGAFVGIACQDLTGRGQTADFYSLKYDELA